MSMACRRLVAFLVVLSGVAGLRGAGPERPDEKEANPTYKLRRKLAGAGMGAWFALSADGKRYATSRDVQPPGQAKAEVYFVVWNLETGKKVQQVRSPDGPRYPFALSPDGRLLAAPGLGRNISVWNVATGKEIQSFHGSGGAVFAMTFSPDGKLLAETSHDSVNVWNVVSGKKVQEYEEDGRFYAVAFSPDSKLVVAGTAGAERPIYAWSLATGMVLAQYAGIASPKAPTPIPLLPTKLRRLTVGFTKDGDRIFLGGKDASAFGLWETDTGRLLYRGGKLTDLQDAVFSSDGQTVLTATRDAVIVWDVFTGKERSRLADSLGMFFLSYSNTGRSLVGCDVQDVCLWDHSPAISAKRAAPTDPELDRIWTELRTDNPRQARRTVANLIAAPDSTLPFLAKHAKPAPMLDPQRIAQLIRDLDSDKFPVRQKAMDELEKFGPMADEALRRALAAKPPLEVRRRIEQIRERQVCPYPTDDGELLRTLRAIEVLEQIGTAEARQVLETLAKGAASARPTEEAKAALRRLARKAG